MTEASQLGVLPRIARDHAELVEHIVSGDPKQAVEAMKNHNPRFRRQAVAGFPRLSNSRSDFR